MYEIRTVEQIDEPLVLDAGNTREALEAFVKDAVDNGYWEDISTNDTAYVWIKRNGGRRKYFFLTLDQRTSYVVVAVSP